MTKSETISREENIRCRLCICEAVEYFREGLRLFVPLRLESACGPNWIPKVNDRIDEENKKKGIKRQRTSRLRVSTNGKKVQWDSRSLLKAIHFTFKDAFQEEFECTQYRVTWLWKQLNGFSHEKSFYFKGTELTLKGMEYILKAAKSLEKAKLVEGVRRRLVDESPAVLPPIDKPRSPMNPTADKPENGGGQTTKKTITPPPVTAHSKSEVCKAVCLSLLKKPPILNDKIAQAVGTSEKLVQTGRRILTAAEQLPPSGRLNPVGKKICELLRQNSQRSDKDIAAEVQRVCKSKTSKNGVAQHRSWLKAAGLIQQK